MGNAEQAYAIVYRNHPNFKGLDVFYVGGGPSISCNLDDALLTSFDVADKLSRKYPVVDDAHLVAIVVPVTLKTEVVARTVHMPTTF